MAAKNFMHLGEKFIVCVCVCVCVFCVDVNDEVSLSFLAVEEQRVRCSKCV